ncbi:prolyl 4-hydroxylase subunit alpha-2-like [Rhipicephalus sanguineus]|uniref:prolyl 4-hydroxylase subunit alpha-2-like n=1 Tax=Rhipicephalus sanguineus TaxID=34632 RepID=UPI001892F322|nr:prolyl 4-hydroxylase subunit alpha-2-like [Rhipicephalus sanguineus]
MSEERMVGLALLYTHRNVGISVSEVPEFSGEVLLRDYLVTVWLSYNWPELADEQAELSAHNGYLLEEPMPGNGQWPSDEDLTGAAVGLCRLQHTYGLDVQQMAELKSPFLNVSAHDRHVVGRSCFDEGDVANGIGWWASSLDALELEDDEPSEERLAVLQSMARLTMRLQDKTAAFRLLLAYQDGAPAHLRARLVARAQADSRLKWSFLASDAARFESMCSRNYASRPSPSPGLRCLILHIVTDTMLMWRPLRVELLNEAPKVALVHNFLTRSETRTLKELATPFLYRATVFGDDRRQIPASTRISKVAWLRDDPYSFVARLSAAVSATTGLRMESAELIQVVNYGVGGHYSPHADYTLPHEQLTDMELTLGQRAATWLMYLSSVTVGGSTIFPSLGIKVDATEGRALFWINLLPKPSNESYFVRNPMNRTRSQGDHRTMHGACPVLVGSKWIATKWIHELGQSRIPHDWPTALTT